MNYKKIILIIITILILLTIILGTIIIINYKKNKYVFVNDEYEDESNIKIKYEYKKIDNDTLYFTVSNCVQKYFDYVSLKLVDNSENLDYKTKQDELNINTEQEKKQAIYNILDKEYIDNNNIDLNNIDKYVDVLNKESNFIPMEMGMLDGERIQRFCVYGKIDNKSIYIIVNLDYYNLTYSIEPLLENKYSSVNEIKLDSKYNEIEENNNNSFEYVRMGDADIAREYMINYKTNMINDIDKAYASLDEEYRNKRFGSIENYRQYITDNKAQLQNSAVKEYNSSEKEGYTQYVVVDTSGNYYIFKSTGVMEYTVITDFYTTDIEEIVNKYDESNVQGKVAINIQKVIAALNSKDYKYVYSKLSEEFKANKYPTLEQFKEYISTKLYDNVQMSFGEFRNEGDTYIYNIILKSTKISQGNPINMQIIMKLTDNRDYVMSFNIQ